ncbi:MAG TPA: NAD-dependent epimerase/dehydratase family protein [Bryobacteraceae bacterium]|nr:NAD-dependent epimerase/dehydratase family protein [Bryobacteraceae bacterium]
MRLSYNSANVLITGGLGFVGSNLALRLVENGARVTVVDDLLPGCGGNLFNIEPAKDRIQVLRTDIGEAGPLREAIASADLIFNLAGEISHIHSMQFPERDLQVNTIAQLRFLLACRELNRGVRIVYAGTRQVYGVPKYLPVDEGHPIAPVDFNGVHKYAATMYHLMMTRVGDLDAIVLRLTNVYGPRMALNVSCQGFLSTFLRRLMLGEPLEIFGDGKQLRDPVFVDDAVDAFIAAGLAARPPERSYNVGGRAPLALAEIARTASAAAGLPEPVFREFPAEREAIDIGSYYTDNRRIERDLGWKAKVDFSEGIARTLEYFRAHLDQYIHPNEPPCKLPEHSGAPRRLTYIEV